MIAVVSHFPLNHQKVFGGDVAQDGDYLSTLPAYESCWKSFLLSVAEISPVAYPHGSFSFSVSRSTRLPVENMSTKRIIASC